MVMMPGMVRTLAVISGVLFSRASLIKICLARLRATLAGYFSSISSLMAAGSRGAALL